MESESTFLHGNLTITIHDAKDLPDTDGAWYRSSKNKTDAFCSVKLFPSGLKLAETGVIYDSLNPEWEEKKRLLACYNGEYIQVSVKDSDTFNGDDYIGTCRIPCLELKENHSEDIEKTYELQIDEDDDKKSRGTIRITYNFTPFNLEETTIEHSIDTYFPARENNKVHLYQCADTPNLPIFNGIVDSQDQDYVPTRLWRDIHETILGAQKFIYITGWSVFTEISLLRGEEDPDGSKTHLGNLLISKAEEGVKVLVLTWNDQTSGKTFMKEGQMGTHDETTRKFFEDTKVCVANVPRMLEGSESGRVGLVEQKMAATLYTHHQKTVIADVEIPGDERRRLVGYIGGVDLTDGRYDTPEFKLFDYSATHSTDFYQNCTLGATDKTGPRQPWQDIHAKIEGPSVQELIQNFTERWTKQAKKEQQENLYDITEEEFDFDNIGEDSNNPWNVQIFRSATSDSCNFDETKPLHSKRGRLIDDSIFRAYIFAIRRAEHFIYMENQYFMGSAYSWRSEKETNTHHTIPREIVSKIISKIEKGERFAVYICIPMYPEGDPTSVPSQEILYWQRCTMDSMYSKVAEAIKANNLDTKPTDYLMFYCLGKRETMDCVPDNLEDPEEDTPACLTRKSLRHPIYVHSKLMIVDDDYIIIGSANINQRSMAGSRDTEIAMGGCQPDFMSTKEDIPKGDIHTFRLALWSAHLGGYDSSIAIPNSEECVEKVKEITSKFQEIYKNETMEERTDVHMMNYPIEVTDDGDVVDLAGWEEFPDQGGAVAGEKAPMGMIPGNVTT